VQVAGSVPWADAIFLIHPTDYAVIASSTIDAGSGLFTVMNGQIAGLRVIQSSLVPQAAMDGRTKPLNSLSRC